MKSHRKKPVQGSCIQVFNMEMLVPQNHILRKIDKAIDLSKVHEWVDPLHPSNIGRPACDSEQAIRLMLLCYLFNHEERDLYQTLPMHAGYLWFLGLDFEAIQNPTDPTRKLMDRTTLVKARKLWREHGILEMLMRDVVNQCIRAGLVKDEIHAGVDGTQVRANASIHSLCENACVPVASLESYMKQTSARDENETLRKENDGDDDNPKPPTSSKEEEPKLLEKAEHEDFHGKKFSNQTHQSTTDPDSRLYRKSSGQEAHLRYLVHDLIDTRTGIILSRHASQANGTAERQVSSEQILQFRFAHPQVRIKTLSADKAYPTAEYLKLLKDQGIIPLIPQHQSAMEELPTWKTRTFRPVIQAKRNALIEAVQLRNWARVIQDSGKYAHIQRLRARCEHTFAESKVVHGMDRARSRGLDCMEEQALMTAIVQNLKKLCRYLGRKPRSGVLACRQSAQGVKTATRVFQFLMDLLTIREFRTTFEF